jgi:hypothetical protein
MGFFDIARAAAAEEYGKNRAEKYGKQERLIRWIAFFAILGFLIYCYILGQ